MTIKAASESALGALHSKVAKIMAGALDVYDTEQELYLKSSEVIMENADDPELVSQLAGLTAPQPNASLLSVITKFLSDNHITCAAEESKELTDLERALNDRKAKRRRVDNVVHLQQ